MKRLCVKKLPPILAIQLKRFEYDFERVCAIKFNDYFEFPRDLDMEPYTVSGLAKLEGEVIDCDYEESVKGTCTKYQLTGIVVHSGQASGGHYYSYILHRYSQHVDHIFMIQTWRSKLHLIDNVIGKTTVPPSGTSSTTVM